METLFVATILIIVGVLAALGGHLLFRILLPIVGFFFGYGIGFVGLQTLFGVGFVSTTLAIITGLVLGLVLAALSYFYYFLAIVVLGASLLASAFAFFGQAIGLSENGFLVFLLALTGAIIGGTVIVRARLDAALIVYLTAFIGVGMVFIGLALLVGGLTMEELNRDGILQSIRDTVGSSFIWLMAWFGGSIVAALFQQSTINSGMMSDTFTVDVTK